MPSEVASDSERSRLRLDVEGLRAVAILSVVGYHGAARLFPAGFVGVDVFFVISGFLITSMIIREVDATGTLSLARFWSRRAKRLLPAAAVVLAFCTLITAVALPVTQRAVFGWDLVAAALYVVNWRLAGRSVDYLAEGVATSPVEHFWSLAVEEQFYILWPVLIVATVLLARRLSLPRRAAIVGVLATVTAVSLAWSIGLTATSQPTAFFVTHTRVWELGIGALTALFAGQLAALTRRYAQWMGAAGLLAVVVSVYVFSTQSSWPGAGPLLPCLGTAAVIVAGMSGPTWVSRALSMRPLVWIGGLSYSIYLWHWPFLVGATALWGDLGIRKSALVLVASLIPAYAIHKLVENPVRFARRLASPVLGLSVGFCCTLLGVAMGIGLALSRPPENVVTTAPVGAAVIQDGGANMAELLQTAVYDTIVPDPLLATEDLPASYRDNCHQSDTTPPGFCVVGDPDGELRIVAVGDSMIQQWEPALALIGRKHGLRIEVYALGQCTFAARTIVSNEKPNLACRDWGTRVLEVIVGNPPDLVITSQGSWKALAHPDDPVDSATEDAMVEGMKEYLAAVHRAGARVALLEKNPYTSAREPIPECVVRHRDDLTECVYERHDVVGPVQRRTAIEAGFPVGYIDLNDYICSPDRCAAVIGGVLVYRQGSHLTASYVESLAPRLETELLRLIES